MHNLFKGSESFEIVLHTINLHVVATGVNYILNFIKMINKISSWIRHYWIGVKNPYHRLEFCIAGIAISRIQLFRGYTRATRVIVEFTITL